MVWMNLTIIVYLTFILSYLINVLVTELPLDDRYKKLRVHFTFRRFLSLFYFPVIYWFYPYLKICLIGVGCDIFWFFSLAHCYLLPIY